MSGYVSEYLVDRDNNFNLLRFGAALAVFISHCPPVAGLGIISITTLLGYVAVNVFFVISGFLVVKSYYDRQNVFRFFRARILRVYPALILAVLYTVFVVGLTFSNLAPLAYLQDPQTWQYTLDNMLQLDNATTTVLPGLTSWGTVNATLWTLPFELHMYIILALASGLAFKLRWFEGKIVWGIYFIAVALTAAFYFADYAFNFGGYGLGHDRYYLRFFAMFGIGVSMYFLRDKLVLKTRYFVLLLLVIALSSMERIVFVSLAYGLLGYAILYLAYIPSGFLRQFNRLGDYSYGLYIFGYPTQKSVMQLFPDLSVYGLFVTAFSITMLLAIASWHWLEKPMLRFK